MRIVCISGKAQHGKDTSANFMKEYLEDRGYSVLVVHFADLLKYICSKFFQWNGEKDEVGRALLQYVGTDVVREKRPDFWVEFIKSVLTLFCDEWDFVLLPDCRFPNEYEGLKTDSFDVSLVSVVRSNFQSPLNEEQQKHRSEIALDGYTADYYLINDGTLDHLEREVINLSKRLLNGGID